MKEILVRIRQRNRVEFQGTEVRMFCACKIPLLSSATKEKWCTNDWRCHGREDWITLISGTNLCVRWSWINERNSREIMMMIVGEEKRQKEKMEKQHVSCLVFFVHLRRGNLSAKLLLEEEAVVEKAVYIPVKVQVTWTWEGERRRKKEKERDNNCILGTNWKLSKNMLQRREERRQTAWWWSERMIMKEHHEKTRG